MIFNKKSTAKLSMLLMLVFVFSVADAQILAGLSPKGKQGGILDLYPEETGYLTLSLFNSGSVAQKVTLTIKTDDSTAFIESGNIQQAVARQVVVEPGKKSDTELLVIALRSTDKAQSITAVFGDNNSQFASTSIRVLPTLVLVETGLPETKRNFGNIRVKATNTGSEAIHGLKIDFITMRGLDSKEPSFQLGTLLPKEKIEKEFSFYVDPGKFDKKTIIIQTSFSDSNGFHILEKQVKFSPPYGIGALETIAIAIIGIVAIILAVNYLRKEKKPAEEKKK
ncbi:MAG: hypothetical protein PHH08_05010 [Candidatus ainarchaeum sp.]|nr:hypothetical protein [Candidatus ainarchaeum sp.]